VVEIEQAYRKIKEMRSQGATYAVLSRLLDRITCFEGRHDKGKTLSVVAISRKMRDIFHRHVVVVESSMGLKPAYGKFSFLSVRQMVKELEKISKAAENGANEMTPEELDLALKEQGISLYNALVIFDEANKLFEVGTWNNPLVLLVSYMIQQMAHYHMTVLIATPRRMDITPRVREQVDYWARPTYHEFDQTCEVSFYKLSEVRQMKLTINARKYFDLYDRWALIGFRGKSLRIKEADL